jgi:putative ABC transport system permease protein
MVVYQQLEFIQNKNLGFDKEQELVIPVGDQQSLEATPLLRQALQQHPQILQASTVNHIPGHQRGGYALIADGLDLPDNEYFPIGGVPVDPYVVETLGLNIIAGNDFSESAAQNVEDGTYQYLVNRATIEALGWDESEAIGKRMGLSSNRMGTLVGIIEDYHFLSLHEQIYPMAFFVEPRSCNYLLVKMAPGQVQPTLDIIETAWNERITHRPFTYSFLDQEIDALYRSEYQTGQVFALVSLIAVLIACLGLFGLAAFATGRRTKEVGIRKVLGATVGQIIYILSREFTVLVFIAFVVATPVAILVMGGWLENFAYQVEMSWYMFALAGLAALGIAWLTVSYQAIKAARANPVQALRYE